MNWSGAADAFDPLGPGGYVGEIELGAFVEHVIRNGHRHGVARSSAEYWRGQAADRPLLVFARESYGAGSRQA